MIRRVVIGGRSLSAPGLHLVDRPLNTVGIPLLNILIACQVAIGSWTIVLLFIRQRGLH